MMNYVLYANGYNECIAEVLNLTDTDILEIQKDLLKDGYIIDELCGKYIKCHRANKI